jgi:4-amino-4-deoxy-L-arabinose transferase-like glycosyltransferase
VLIAVVVVGAVARTAWAAWIAHADPAAVRAPDTPTYLGPARALIDAGRFSLTAMDPTPMFVRTPGYPAFLAPILWLTDSEWAISPIQATVTAMAVAVVILLGRRLLGLTAGLVAGALVMLDPLQFVAAGKLLTEGLTTVLVIAIVAVGALVLALRRPAEVPRIATLGLGTLVALVAIVRPTFWFYPLLVVALLVARLRTLPRRRLLGHLLAFILPVAVVVGGWQVRNHTAVESWQLSGISGINLYCYNAAEVEARVQGTSIETVRNQFGCPIERCQGNVGGPCWITNPDAPGQGFDEWGRKGTEILLDHPLQTARGVAAGIVRQVAGPGTDTVTDYLSIEPSRAFSGVLFVWAVVLWSFAAVGAGVGLRSRHRAFWAFVVTTIAYVLVISAGPAAYARFRTPIVPLVALLAALGLQHCVRRVRGARPVPVAPNERRAAPADLVAP